MRPLLIGAGLVLAVLAVYGQALSFDFVGFDDPGYVTDNEQVRAGLSWRGVQWAFTTSAMGNWHPLTWLSLMLDQELGGGASVFHLTNVVLHALNALLLFHVLLRKTGRLWPAAFAAALFAVHPQRVESVAWVAERKDPLSALFFLLALLAWVRYTERPGIARYLLVFVAFALGLMSKPMLVTLPLLLLLLDYWPLQRGGPLRQRLAEKAPLFGLAALSSAVTVWAQSAVGAVAAIESFPLGLRAANALVSYARYVLKTFWPSRLALPYPYDPEILGPLQLLGAALLLVAISFLVLREAGRRPYLVTGWAWFVIGLLPVIGLVQVGSQAMADRYTYLPAIGLFVAVTWGAADLLCGKRALLAVAGGAATATLIVTAHLQAAHWRDTTTLFEHTLEVSENNAVAHDLLGLESLEAGTLDRALAHFADAVRIAPDYAGARANLAAALGRAGRHGEALEQRREVLARRPDDPDAHAHLGLALSRLGSHDKALASFADALELAPDHPAALKGSGVALTRQGRTDEALDYLLRAVRADPEDTESWSNLGTVHLRRSDLVQAEAAFVEAVRADADNAGAHKNLGVVLARQGRTDEAIVHFTEALRIDPHDEGARRNLERARSMLD